MGRNDVDERMEKASTPVGTASAESTASRRSPSKRYLKTFYLSPEIISRMDRLQGE